MQITRNNTDQYVVCPPQEQYCDFNRVYVPSLYIVLPGVGWQATVAEEEATEREILCCLEKSGQFDFLKNPDEDIYCIGDGEPV